MKALPTLYERLRMDMRIIPAFAMIVLFIFLDIATMHFPFDGIIKPNLFLVAVFYWSIYRPSLVPVWLIFIAGLTLDFIAGTFSGLHTIPLIAVSWLVTRQRSFLSGQNFIMIWSIFSGIHLCVISTQWLLSMATSLNFEFPRSLIFSAFLTLCVYPVCHMILFLTHKLLPAR
jgi:rod shape-determining protein MreD